jgi:hypothetical protein
VERRKSDVVHPSLPFPEFMEHELIKTVEGEGEKDQFVDDEFDLEDVVAELRQLVGGVTGHVNLLPRPNEIYDIPQSPLL